MNVICAMDLGNLESIAKIFRAKHKDKQIIIACDWDIETKDNPGYTKAMTVKFTINGEVAVPRNGFISFSKKMDFNDVHCELGLDVVAECFEPQRLE